MSTINTLQPKSFGDIANIFHSRKINSHNYLVMKVNMAMSQCKINQHNLPFARQFIIDITHLRMNAEFCSQL